MARSLFNWTFKDVGGFLRQRGFSYFEDVEGIGPAWMSFHKNGEPNRMVEVRLTHVAYKPKAMRQMIRQSGIPEAEWLAWNGD